MNYELISPYQLMAEAQRGAVMAEAQLEADVAAIKSVNDDRKQFNDLVMAVATDATGKNPGRTPTELARGSRRAQPEQSTVEDPETDVRGDGQSGVSAGIRADRILQHEVQARHRG